MTGIFRGGMALRVGRGVRRDCSGRGWFSVVGCIADGVGACVGACVAGCVADWIAGCVAAMLPAVPVSPGLRLRAPNPGRSAVRGFLLPLPAAPLPGAGAGRFRIGRDIVAAVLIVLWSDG